MSQEFKMSVMAKGGILAPIEVGQEVVDSVGKHYWYAFEHIGYRYFSTISKSNAEEMASLRSYPTGLVNLERYTKFKPEQPKPNKYHRVA